MKVATDTWMLRPLSVEDVFRTVGEIGYRAVEWAPRDDFLPPHAGRRASRAMVERVLCASRETGVEIASIWVEYGWGSEDEVIREASVRYWRQAIETAVELGCRHLNGEFSGDHQGNRGHCEAALLRSLDEILPLCEREGVAIAIEPHPGDFIESAFHAIDFIRGLRVDSLTYLHCVPHRFYLGGSNREVIEYAGTTLGHVHVADTYVPERTILNPGGPGGIQTNVRVHQHLDLGMGDTDWDEVFESLREAGYDGTITVCIFRAEDRLHRSLTHNLSAVNDLIARHFGETEAAP